MTALLEYLESTFHPYLVLLFQETLLTFQSTQLGPGGLVSSGEAAYPAVTFTGEANAQLSLSHLVVLRLLWIFKFRDLSW